MTVIDVTPCSSSNLAKLMVGRNQGMLESPKACRDSVNGQTSYDEVSGLAKKPSKQGAVGNCAINYFDFRAESSLILTLGFDGSAACPYNRHCSLNWSSSTSSHEDYCDQWLSEVI